MSQRDYERGVEDGRNNSTAADPSKGPVQDLVFGISDKEIEERRDYHQGVSHGRDQRKS